MVTQIVTLHLHDIAPQRVEDVLIVLNVIIPSGFWAAVLFSGLFGDKNEKAFHTIDREMRKVGLFVRFTTHLSRTWGNSGFIFSLSTWSCRISCREVITCTRIVGVNTLLVMVYWRTSLGYSCVTCSPRTRCRTRSYLRNSFEVLRYVVLLYMLLVYIFRSTVHLSQYSSHVPRPSTTQSFESSEHADHLLILVRLDSKERDGDVPVGVGGHNGVWAFECWWSNTTYVTRDRHNKKLRSTSSSLPERSRRISRSAVVASEGLFQYRTVATCLAHGQIYEKIVKQWRTDTPG